MTEAVQSRDTVRDVPPGLPVLPPLAALLEIAILVVCPGLLDLFVAGFPSLNDTQPHFFWLPVLLLTLQYGSASGLLAAGAAIVFASILGWPEQEIGENHFAYLLRIWLQPVLWIAAAVILGQLRLRQIERKQSLAQSVERLTEQRAALAEHAQHLRERCDRLERVIATRHDADAMALMAALGRTQMANPELADEALRKTIALAFGDCRLSVLRLRGDELRTVFRHGAATEFEPGTISPESPFFEAVVGRQAGLSVLSPTAAQALDGLGLAAVPILSGGTVVGAVMLEDCSPDLLDAATLDRLAAIALTVGNRPPGASLRSAIPRSAPLGASTETVPAEGARVLSWRRIRRRADRPGSAASREGRRA
ncbi:MAG: hypothetical protein AB7L90_22495 [Hyphomicrobiaceae bacterium]